MLHLSCKKILVVAIVWLSAHLGPARCQTFDCDPCIDRSKYTIRVIVHGTKNSEFWRRVQSSSLQAGREMGVTLQMDLYDPPFDSGRMADDIITAAVAASDGPPPPDALVVSIPSDDVADAVRAATDAGVPVFGLNSGYGRAADVGVLGFVAMDEYLGGIEAANSFLKLNPSIGRALYVNLEKGNLALEQRREGFADRLGEVNDQTVVDELVLDGHSDGGAEEMTAQLSSQLEGCPYDAMLLSSSAANLLDGAVAANNVQGCKGKTRIGTFDTNTKVFTNIAFGRIDFGISQQENLQGSLPVHMAAIYVTTGQKLELSSGTDDGLYLSGPKVFDAESQPSDTILACTSDAFPVCPNTLGPDGTESDCPCTDRSLITIAGVLHGVTSDPFWDPVFAASEQAARDMGITLKLDRLEPPAAAEDGDDDALHATMADMIEKHCNDGVDGVYVTIPSDVVVPAIQSCLDQGIPVVSINAGADKSEALGLMHHIGQLEYTAGLRAGLRVVELSALYSLPAVRVVYCLNHAPGVAVTAERCRGVEDATSLSTAWSTDVTYGGTVVVPPTSGANDTSAYISIVDEAVGETWDGDDDWSGIGLVVLGETQFHSAVALKEAHPGVAMGTFDAFAELSPALDDGTFLFGVDQEAYLQGYFPVSLLTYYAYTEQRLVNGVIESGPGFVEGGRTASQQICDANFYEVCDDSSSLSTMPTPTEEAGVATPSPSAPSTGAMPTTPSPSGAIRLGTGFVATALCLSLSHFIN